MFFKKVFTMAATLLSIALAAPTTNSLVERQETDQYRCNAYPSNLVDSDMAACCNNFKQVATQTIPGNFMAELCVYGTTIITAISLDGYESTCDSNCLFSACDLIRQSCGSIGGMNKIGFAPSGNFGMSVSNRL